MNSYNLQAVAQSDYSLISDMRAYSKKYRQCSLHDVKCLRDNRRELHVKNCCCSSGANRISIPLDVFSSLKPPNNIDALNESSPGMECFCPPTCSELVTAFGR